MSDVQKHAAIFSEELLEAIRLVVREETQAAMGRGTTRSSSLLTAGELANHLKVPVSWVYEPSKTRYPPPTFSSENEEDHKIRHGSRSRTRT